MEKFRFYASLAAALVMIPVPGNAGGLGGNLVEFACGRCGAGKALDRINKQAKKDFEPYRRVEEGISDPVRKGFRELNGEVDGRILAQWIKVSRRDVVSAGVEPIPAHIREELRGFISDAILDKVRFRAGWGNELALPALSFRFGDAAAITLDEVVMFRSWNDADTNLTLWAHELTHVQQYHNWGIDKFAKRYMKDHGGVEAEAERNAERFAAWYDRGGAGNLQLSNEVSFIDDDQAFAQQSSQMGNFCRTELGFAGPGRFQPVGAYCSDTWGNPGHVVQ
jgi:Domain of unknown function (DUF4157)